MLAAKLSKILVRRGGEWKATTTTSGLTAGSKVGLGLVSASPARLAIKRPSEWAGGLRGRQRRTPPRARPITRRLPSVTAGAQAPQNCSRQLAHGGRALRGAARREREGAQASWRGGRDSRAPGCSGQQTVDSHDEGWRRCSGTPPTRNRNVTAALAVGQWTATASGRRNKMSAGGMTVQGRCKISVWAAGFVMASEPARLSNAGRALTFYETS